MPRKDRLKSCINPFSLPHKNPRNILTISTVLLIDCHTFLPDVNISSHSTLCFQCRTELYRRINEARRGDEVHQVQQSQEEGSADVATTSGSSGFSGFKGLPFFFTGIKRKKVETITSEESHEIADVTTSSPEIRSASNLVEQRSTVDAEEVVRVEASHESAESESSSSGHRSSSIVSSGLSEAPLEDLNLKLVTSGISPAKRGDLSKPGVMKSKLNRSAAAVEKNVQQAMQRTSATPVTLSKECIDCKTLVEGMKERLSALNDKRLRYFLLTCAPSSMPASKLQLLVHCTEYEARKAKSTREQKGIFQHPEWISSGHPLDDNVKKRVRDIYLNDEYGRVSPNAQETILVSVFDALGNKTTKRVAKRRMLLNLSELYQVFREKNPTDEIRISSFAALRPKQCTWPGYYAKHNVCTCLIHENFKFMIEAAQTQDSVGDYLRRFLCNDPKRNCYMGLCDKCPHYDQLDTLDEFFEAGDVTYQKWESVDRMNISSKTVSVETFKTKIKDSIPKVSRHHYIMKQQQDYIRNLKDRIKTERSVIINVDFGENYHFVVQDEVYGYHWSNSQATLHPFHVSWYDNVTGTIKYKTYMVVSDSLKHDTDHFHAFRSKVFDIIKSEAYFEGMTKVYYISDGAASQYKNCKNFCHIFNHVTDFGLIVEWIFTATAHGKSECDAACGVAKRTAKIHSLKGVRITTPTELYNFLLQKLETTSKTYVYCSTEEVQLLMPNILLRNEQAIKVVGTQKFHSIEVVGNALRCRYFSNDEEYTDVNYVNREIDTIPLSVVNVGEFVAVKSSGSVCVGMVAEVTVTDDDSEFRLQIMKQARKSNCFTWPDPEKYATFNFNEVISKLQAPSTATGRLYVLSQQDFLKLK